jgi:beta-mannosidase
MPENGREITHLNGLWTLQQGGSSQQFPARVPGTILSDLLTAGQIPDPYYRDNESKAQWIGEKDWTLARTFELPESVLRRQRILLRCEGLDTFASIRLNGHEVGRTDNMFRTHEFDIGSLAEVRNEIEITFSSVLPYMKAKTDEKRLAAWNEVRGILGRAYVRKQPCNFGWDWGPDLVSYGIWKDISIVAFDQGRLNDVFIRQEHQSDGRVALELQVGAEPIAPSPLTIRCRLERSGDTIGTCEFPINPGTGHGKILVENPELWWPAGMGAQPLYDLEVTLLDDRANEIDRIGKRIGLRTLRLQREPDPWGESFHFTANGVPFFAKGANWIPVESFTSPGDEGRTRDFLESAAAAHMNMIRVWGGGYYPHDHFFDTCDELGLCIWQDFMFACSTYPLWDPDFVENARVEAVDNVRRIRHHACLALWCGNNEIEQGMNSDGWSDCLSWDDYRRFFDDTLAGVVHEFDPQRDYWPSSSHTPGENRSDHNDPTRGDAHLWNVWVSHTPFEWYQTCEHRFNSEFGFQSFPELRTVAAFTEPGDRNITSPIMELHQKSPPGNSMIFHHLLDWFRMPVDFELTLRVTQIVQGLAIQYGVEHWRRSMPRGMGTLYWQLNDCWPVASWASIDSFGRWKALHYMARRFFAPVIISGVEDRAAGTVDVHLTSDLLTDDHGTAHWHAYTPDGSVLDEGSIEVSIPSRQDTRIATLDFSTLLDRHGTHRLVIWLELGTDAGHGSRSVVLFERPKKIDWEPAAIATSVSGSGDQYEITLLAERPALWTWLDLRDLDCRFSDNFFHLRPHAPQTITARPAVAMTREDFEGQLQIRSLRDTYREV